MANGLEQGTQKEKAPPEDKGAAKARGQGTVKAGNPGPAADLDGVKIRRLVTAETDQATGKRFRSHDPARRDEIAMAAKLATAKGREGLSGDLDQNIDRSVKSSPGKTERKHEKSAVIDAQQEGTQLHAEDKVKATNLKDILAPPVLTPGGPTAGSLEVTLPSFPRSADAGPTKTEGPDKSLNNFGSQDDIERGFNELAKPRGLETGQTSEPPQPGVRSSDLRTRPDSPEMSREQKTGPIKTDPRGSEGNIVAEPNKNSEFKTDQTTKTDPSQRGVIEKPTGPQSPNVRETREAPLQQVSKELPKDLPRNIKPETLKAILEQTLPPQTKEIGQKVEPKTPQVTKEIAPKDYKIEKVVTPPTTQQEAPKAVQRTSEPVIERRTEVNKPTQVIERPLPVKEATIIQLKDPIPQTTREPVRTEAREIKLESKPVVTERIEKPEPTIQRVVIPERLEPKLPPEIVRETPRALNEKVEKDIVIQPRHDPQRETEIVPRELPRVPDRTAEQHVEEARHMQELRAEAASHQLPENIDAEAEAPILEQAEYTSEKLEERVEERIESRIEIPETSVEEEPSTTTDLSGRASDDTDIQDSTDLEMTLVDEVEIEVAKNIDAHQELQPDLEAALEDLRAIVNQRIEPEITAASQENQTIIQINQADRELLEALRDSHGLTIETLAELQSVLRALDNSYVPEAVVPEVQQELKHILGQVAHTLAQQVHDGEVPKNIRDLIPHDRIRKLILDALHEIQLRQRLAELEANPEKKADAPREDNTIKKITKEVIQEIKEILGIEDPVEDLGLELDHEQELQDQDLEQKSRGTEEDTELEEAYKYLEETEEDRDLSVYDINGQIIDLETGIGLPGVTVFGGLLGRAVTDLGGFYVFRNIPKGTGYTVGPDKPGYRFTPEAVSGTISLSVRHDFVGKRRR